MALILAVTAIPLIAAATSPLLQWRTPIYIIGGFAGVVGMALLFLQPLLASGLMPGLNSAKGRKLHRLTGAALIVAIVIHVGGLWITSPPDVIDALTFTSPTPFAAWGVIAMWAAFGAALLAVYRRQVGPKIWRPAHSSLVLIVVIGTVVHALQIEGTMETWSKLALALACLGTIALALRRMRPWTILRRRQSDV